MIEPFNVRVLVIDDEEVVRDSFREILTGSGVLKTEALDASAVALFGESVRQIPRSSGAFNFVLDEAASGEAGLALLGQAVADRKPYALIFLDMRMPGWDGVVTAKRIREVDEKVEIVFVTAYSDYTIEQIVSEAGHNVGYHCKPFAPDEIRQIATKAVYEWNKLRSLESLIKVTGELRVGEKEVDQLLRGILHQVCERVGSQSAVVVSRGRTDGVFSARLALGEFADPERLRSVLDELAAGPPVRELVRRGRLLLIKIDEYTLLTLLDDESGINTERLYLLRIFVEHASRALEASRLQGELVRRERMATLGSAMNQVVHDLKQPISVIHAAIHLIDSSTSNPERLATLHRMIGVGVQDLMDYVEDILAFTRGDAVVLEPTDLSEFLTVIEEKARYLLGVSQHWLRFDIEPHIDAMVAPRKIQRVVLNLISNGIEALTGANIETPSVVVSLRKGVDRVVISVADNGPGVPEAIRGTLFEPFVTYGKSGGTGLGLAIGRQIAEAHGGTLDRLDSSCGALFELRLQPVLDTDCQQSEDGRKESIR